MEKKEEEEEEEGCCCSLKRIEKLLFCMRTVTVKSKLLLIVRF